MVVPFCLLRFIISPATLFHEDIIFNTHVTTFTTFVYRCHAMPLTPSRRHTDYACARHYAVTSPCDATRQPHIDIIIPPLLFFFRPPRRLSWPPVVTPPSSPSWFAVPHITVTPSRASRRHTIHYNTTPSLLTPFSAAACHCTPLRRYRHHHCIQFTPPAAIICQPHTHDIAIVKHRRPSRLRFTSRHHHHHYRRRYRAADTRCRDTPRHTLPLSF